jgi:hypothetical protein
LPSHSDHWSPNPQREYRQKYVLVNSSQESLNTVMIYDFNMQWFTRVWLFERRRFYDNTPLLSSVEFFQVPPNVRGQIKKAYLVKSTEFGALDQKSFWTKDSAALENLAVSQGSVPIDIRRSDGQVAYKIYEIRFN